LCVAGERVCCEPRNREKLLMTPGLQISCSFALTFGVPVAIAAWEYWRLKPTGWRPPPGEEVPPDPAPLPDAGILPRIQKPLPACLIPQALPARAPQEVPERVREFA
jgi:hypothetical protein